MISRRFLGTSFGIAAILLLAAPVGAEGVRGNPRAVVELFTSQGCAACPPADALLTSLAEQPDVIALAYHVDYWDYIGWTDTFGAEANSDRQRDYAKSWGSSRIYTPQMVVNGTKDVVGSRRPEVHSAIDAASLKLPVNLSVDGDMLKIAIAPQEGVGNATVWLVTYLDRADVDIERGENAGKKVVYTQVVTGRQVLGMWEAATGAYLKLPLGELMNDHASGLAIIVQQEKSGLPGPILGAAAFER